MYCLDGLPRAIKALPAVYADGSDAQAREEMSFASLLSGLSLANAGLGAVHGFAAPLGGMLDAPHGELCAAVLPHATAINIRALRQRAPQHASLQRYTRIASLLTIQKTAAAESVVTALEEFMPCDENTRLGGARVGCRRHPHGCGTSGGGQQHEGQSARFNDCGTN